MKTEMQEILTPNKPLSRIIKEGTIGSCPICHSIEVRKYDYWLFSFGKKIGCINPECTNYFNKIKS